MEWFTHLTQSPVKDLTPSEKHLIQAKPLRMARKLYFSKLGLCEPPSDNYLRFKVIPQWPPQRTEKD